MDRGLNWNGLMVNETDKGNKWILTNLKGVGENGSSVGGNRQPTALLCWKSLLKRCWIKWAWFNFVLWSLTLISWFLLFSIYWEDLFCTSATPGRRLDSSGNCINSFKPLGCYSVNYFSVIKDATTQKHNVLWNGRWSLCPPSPAASLWLEKR